VGVLPDPFSTVQWLAPSPRVTPPPAQTPVMKRGAADTAWALRHPEEIAHFGCRGVHEMTANAKEIARADEGRTPLESYFVGCSDGGREALMGAQRSPKKIRWHSGWSACQLLGVSAEFRPG
jgi:hypothetical protein